MKRITLLLIVVMFAAGADGVANEKGGAVRRAVVRKYDANGDGKLDSKEAGVVLKKYDANGNGKLDQDEKRVLARDVRRNKSPKKSAASATGKAPLKYERAHDVSYAPKYSMADWAPVKRTTKEIALVEESTAKSEKESWQLKFYRNNAYKCGLSGHYTFVVVEP